MNKLLFLLACGLIWMAVPALAQMTPKAIPAFVPVSGWTIKPAIFTEDRDLKNISLPCMMMTEYDNGFSLRLSGGEGRMLAMAVDFRQDVFNRGMKYDSSIFVNSVNVGEVKATAFSDNTLIFNARVLNNFYQMIQAGGQLLIDVEGNRFQFALGNTPEALARLEQCFSGDRFQSTATLAQPVGVPLAPGAIAPPNAPMVDEMVSPTAPTPIWEQTKQNLRSMPPPVSEPQAMNTRASEAVMTKKNWQAQAGDSLRGTLIRWSEMAGVTLDWQANIEGIVAQDIDINSSFEEAVQLLMAQNSAVTGLEANMIAPTNPSGMPIPLTPAMVGPTPMPAMVSPAVQAPMVSTMPPAMPVGGPVSLAPPPMTAPSQSMASRWTIPAGSDLRSVLLIWSNRAGVELYWNANQSFATKQPIANNGSYEAAVEEMLKQFANDDIRPVGQLNMDPSSGRRILVVDSSRVL
ncbi:MAG: TcpQ domain-containing protein [Pseudomonadota bacterium]